MRLLETHTGLFRRIDDPKSTPYAILSHVWSRTPGGELSYQDVLAIQNKLRSELSQGRDSRPPLTEGPWGVRASIQGRVLAPLDRFVLHRSDEQR